MVRTFSKKPDLEKQGSIEKILELVAEERGDITAEVLDLYFERYPQAREIFQEAGSHNTELRLQQEMVETGLYCLMTYFERPTEVEIILLQTVPHHNFLNIPTDYFCGLNDAIFDVMERTIPMDYSNEKRSFQELRTSLTEIIQSSSEE